MDPVEDPSDTFAFLDEMENEFDKMKNENKKLEEILFIKEKQLRKSEAMIFNLEKHIERIFEFFRSPLLFKKL